MLQLLLPLKSLVKAKPYYIDSTVFKLHYQFTVSLILGFCLILSAKVLFGDPIDCKSRSVGSEDFFDNICYSLGTFTSYEIDDAEIKAEEYQQETALNILDEPFPFVKRSLQYSNITYKPLPKYLYSGIIVPHDNEDKIALKKDYWHRYYNYIPILLIIQAFLFYFPHYLWKIWENGVISSICRQLYEGRFTNTDYSDSVRYLKYCFALNRHQTLVYKYYVCELLLLLNLFAQIIILDKIFNDQFITYGSDVLHYWLVDYNIYGLVGLDGQDFVNSPLDFVFPKITACTVKILSQIGLKPDDKQFLCVLPLNILHDKIYLILWFWFCILAVITAIKLIFNVAYIASSTIRTTCFRRFGPKGDLENWTLAEMFILDLIGSNSDRVAFSSLLERLNKVNLPTKNQAVTV